MKFLTYGTASILAALCALAACGSSDSGGTGSAVPCNTRALADCDAEVSCSQTKCSSELKTCFGADYKSGTCGTYLQCINACGCNDTTCTSACGAPSAACQSCIGGTLTQCEQTNGCTALCSSGTAGSGAGGSSGSGAGGTGGGANCTQLAACCATISSTLQPSCNAVVQANTASLCSQFFTAECGSGAGGAGGSSGSGAGATAGVGAGGTGTGAACTQLAGCCPTLATSLQAYCTTLVQYNDAATCSSFYSLECTGGGTAGGAGTGGTGGVWVCANTGTTGTCTCALETTGTAQDLCTTKPPCCVLADLGGTTACACESTGDLSGLTCAQFTTALAGTMVSTCPPG